MSTLKTHNLQSPDSGSSNIALTPNAGMVVTGISTFSNNLDINANIDVSGTSTFGGDITGTGDLYLSDTGTDSSAGPIIDLYRNSASAADADYMGQIKFQGENDAGQKIVYAKITGKIQDASDGTEDGLIEFANKKAGSNAITARLRSDSLQLLNGTALSVAGDITANGNIAGDGSTNVTGIAGVTAATFVGSGNVGVQTSSITHSALVGAGNSFVGMYIGDGSLVFNKYLNRTGGYYISTEVNALNAGPVSLGSTMTLDGTWVIV